MATPFPRWVGSDTTKPPICKPKPIVGTIAIVAISFAADCPPPDTYHFKWKVLLRLTGSVPKIVSLDYVPNVFPPADQSSYSDANYEACLPPGTPLHLTVRCYIKGKETLGFSDCDFGAGGIPPPGDP
jgi:hypothetical protein